MSRILVVDDSRTTRDTLAKLLQSEGYTASTASNGKDAWAMLYGGLPDLILLDLMMPEMGGIMFLRMLRSHHHWHGLAVLVLTGLDQDEAMVQEAKGFGVGAVMRKGDRVDLLLARIGEVLGRRAEGMSESRGRG